MEKSQTNHLRHSRQTGRVRVYIGPATRGRSDKTTCGHCHNDDNNTDDNIKDNDDDDYVPATKGRMRWGKWCLSRQQQTFCPHHHHPHKNLKWRNLSLLYVSGGHKKPSSLIAFFHPESFVAHWYFLLKSMFCCQSIFFRINYLLQIDSLSEWMNCSQ